MQKLREVAASSVKTADLSKYASSSRSCEADDEFDDEEEKGRGEEPDPSTQQIEEEDEVDEEEDKDQSWKLKVKTAGKISFWSERARCFSSAEETEKHCWQQKEIRATKRDFLAFKTDWLDVHNLSSEERKWKIWARFFETRVKLGKRVTDFSTAKMLIVRESFVTAKENQQRYKDLEKKLRL